MEDEAYEARLRELEVLYEARCLRCGCCCGAYGVDPCAQLEKCADGTYSCKVYETRIGTQKTISGKTFSCVPIRQVMLYHKPFPNCPYGR